MVEFPPHRHFRQICVVMDGTKQLEILNFVLAELFRGILLGNDYHFINNLNNPIKTLTALLIVVKI